MNDAAVGWYDRYRLTLGASAVVLGRLSAGLALVVVIAILSRAPGEGVVGSFLTIQAIAGIGVLIARSGHDRSAMRSGASGQLADAVQEVLKDRYWIMASSAVSGLVGSAILAGSTGYAGALTLGALTSVGVIAWTVASLAASVLQAKGQPAHAVVCRDVLPSFVLVLLVLLQSGGSSTSAATSWVTANSIGALVGIVSDRRSSRQPRGAHETIVSTPGPADTPNAYFRVARRVQLLDAVRNNLDGLVVAATAGSIAAGPYWTSLRLSALVTIPFYAIAIAAGPKLARSGRMGAEEFSAVVSSSVIPAAALSTLGLVGLVAVLPWVATVVGYESTRLAAFFVPIGLGRAVDAATGPTAEAMMFGGEERAESALQFGIIAISLPVFAGLVYIGSLAAVPWAAAFFFSALNIARVYSLARAGIHTFYGQRLRDYLPLIVGAAIAVYVGLSEALPPLRALAIGGVTVMVLGLVYFRRIVGGLAKLSL